MTDTPDPTRRPNRNRLLMMAGGGVLLAGVIVAGVMAAGRTGPARANLPAATPTATTAVTPSAPTATTPAPAAAPGLKGTGAPIRVSGTDPVTGRRVDLARFTGRPVVLTIWASWCPGCNQEARDLAGVAAARKDVHFVGINYRDERGGAKGFYSRYGWAFPSVEDASGDMAFKLGLQGTPTTLFLDAEHREIGRIVGATDAAGFTEAIDRITGT